MKRLLIALAIVVVGLVASAKAATFGYTTQGTYGTFAINNYIYGNSYSLADNNAVVSKITVYLSVGGTINFTAKCAIYNMATPSTPALVASTDERTLNNPGSGWFDFTFASPPTLASGSYLLVCWGKINSGTGLNMVTNFDGGEADYAQSIAYTGTFPDPMNETFVSGDLSSIYATYTVSGSQQYAKKKKLIIINQ